MPEFSYHKPLDSRKEPLRARIVMAAFLIVGGGFLTFGIYSLVNALDLDKHGTVVEGQVTEMRTRNRGETYSPVIVYTDHTGQQRTYYSATSTSPPKYFEGQRVAIIYDARDPNFPLSARTADFIGMWLWPIFGIGFGLIFIVGMFAARFLMARGGSVRYDF